MTHAPDMPLPAAIIVAVLLILGAGLTLIGAAGLIRLGSFYDRIHAPTLGTTLGTGSILVASMLFFSVLQTRLVLHELLIAVFMTVTTPVTLILLARATLYRDRRIGATQAYVDPLAAGINDLQELSKTHETISKAKTQTWHRILTHYLPLYFPEIARFAGNSRSDWFLALIERFPTPGSITALEREAFVAEAWPLVGRKVSKARRINDIYETASSSIALPVSEESAAIAMFRMIIAQARGLIRERNRIEEIAQFTLADHHDYQLLRRIPGIGPINALTILAEAGDLRRFGHHRQFLKFCGLDLATCQSGTFRGRTKLSKYGNARLRRTFWMAAQVAARQCDNSFRDKLGRYVAGHADDADRRRKAMKALTAKMARVAHAVVKTGTEYRPFLERSDARWKDPSLQVP